MATITQTIPSYIGGISQQPDELKMPGQLTVAKNVTPDITEGLAKRPGSKLIASLSDGSKNSVTNGRWFHYYRDENEQYIGQVATNGTVKMWCCVDIYVAGVKRHDAGDELNVALEGSSSVQTALTNYLTHTDDEDIQNLTLNDFTYFTNRTKTVAMTSTVRAARPPECFIDLKKVAYASQYSVNVFDSVATNDKLTVKTAIRIKVERDIDTSNCCRQTTGTVDGTNYSHGRHPISGKFPGYLDDTWSTPSSAWGRICNRSDVSEVEYDDEFCHNVSTRIWNIQDETSYTSDQEKRDSNDVNWEIRVFNSSGTAVKDLTGSNARTPKNLYFRISTTGQAAAQGGSGATEYLCRYTTTHDLLYGGEEWEEGDYFYVWQARARYKITIENVSSSLVDANLALCRPLPTPFDTETAITAESILGDIRNNILKVNGGSTDTGFGASSGADIRNIGTGLYLTRTSGAFNVTSPVGELLNVFQNSINSLEDLPEQCAHGYVVKVANSETEEDDWYVEFQADNGIDGKGVWEETAKPGTEIEFDASTMPCQMVREYNSTSNEIEFKIKQAVWEDALVGDTAVGGTNPRPSFVGKKINKLVFFRNRLVIFSDENVIMSRPGSFFNFWNKTAQTFTTSDPIDISCSSEYPAIIYDGLQVNSGLILFTKNQQFMLTTDSDVLSPATAKINSLASYNFNQKTNPISLGTTIGWLDNAGKNSRFFEMSRVGREGEPEVIEQSKLVSKLFDKELTLISNSRENNTIFFSVKDSNTIYCYKYFGSSAKRLQQSWFTWVLQGDVRYHCVLDDSLYAVIRNGTKDVMQKFPLKLHSDSFVSTDDKQTTSTDDDLIYRIHLDNCTEVDDSALSTYDSVNNRTTFTLPTGFNNSSGQLAVYVVPDASDDTFRGRTENATLDGTTVRLPGNWKTYIDHKGTSDSTDDTTETPSNKLILGYQFDMEVKFPTIYYLKQLGEQWKADTRGSLTIHRITFNFGDSGYYETILDRVGKTTYTQTHESPIADAYSTDQVAITDSSIKTIPVYERNKNITLTLKSTHASPMTLHSLTWEGDFNTKFYQRV